MFAWPLNNDTSLCLLQPGTEQTRYAEISLTVSKKCTHPQIPHTIKCAKMMTYHSYDYVHYDAHHHMHNDDYGTMIRPCCYMAEFTLKVGHSTIWI